MVIDRVRWKEGVCVIERERERARERERERERERGERERERVHMILLLDSLAIDVQLLENVLLDLAHNVALLAKVKQNSYSKARFLLIALDS